MNLKNYKLFEKGLRTDEHSHLNDYSSGYDDEADDRLWNRSSSSSTFRDNELEDDEDDIDVDDMHHLLYLLRTMFSNSGVGGVSVMNKGMDITISCTVGSRDRLKNIIKIFEVANKLRKDILSQYDSEMDIWGTKHSSSRIVFTFMYEEGLRDDNAAF